MVCAPPLFVPDNGVETAVDRGQGLEGAHGNLVADSVHGDRRRRPGEARHPLPEDVPPSREGAPFQPGREAIEGEE